jgi:hypothetical protein
LCRLHRGTCQERQHHREHNAADGDQFRGGALTTAFFIPDLHAIAPEMIHGIREAFLVLGAWTILSAIVFRELKTEDGDLVSMHKMLPRSVDDTEYPVILSTTKSQVSGQERDQSW